MTLVPLRLALNLTAFGGSHAWPLHMAVWHVGISKLDQVLEDDNWGSAPIGAGPFSLTYDPQTAASQSSQG